MQRKRLRCICVEKNQRNEISESQTPMLPTSASYSSKSKILIILSKFTQYCKKIGEFDVPSEAM